MLALDLRRREAKSGEKGGYQRAKWNRTIRELCPRIEGPCHWRRLSWVRSGVESWRVAGLVCRIG